tara:strand:+ start:4880 stop:5287 length:408 start_codon:yes stop_codon:yes gene_type:complete
MNQKILILHGPNLNLIGIKSKQEGTTLTLSKINTNLRKIASKQGVKLKIIQTHSQNKANKFIHSNRNKALGILIIPQSWNNYGFILKESLELLEMVYISIQFDNTKSIFNNIVYNRDPLKAYSAGLEKLIKRITL